MSRTKEEHPMDERDCRNCKYNSYKELNSDWVSCNHPVTLLKTPKWEPGDPAFVNYRTGDVPLSEIHNLSGCPTWEQWERR